MNLSNNIANREKSAFETRMEIVACTNNLLAQQSFEELTVKDICKVADISRTAFYYHFYDKFEVYQWHLDRLYLEALAQAGRSYTFHEANIDMLNEVLKFKHLYQAAARLSNKESLASFARQRRICDLTNTLIYHRGFALTEKLVFQIQILADMEIAYVLQWLFEGMPLSVQEMADGLDEIVPRDLANILCVIPPSQKKQ